MPTGNLSVRITDLRGRPINRKIEIEVRRDGGTLGAGGGDFNYSVEAEGATTVLLNGIPNRGGAGSLHSLRFYARGYKSFAFQQFITEGEQGSLQDVFMVRDPKHVESIDAPAFTKLPRKLQDWLDSAQMTAIAREDEDLIGKRGEALYDALGFARRSAILNLFAKASHVGTVGPIWKFFQSPMVIRQDRCFVRMADGIREHVSADSRYVPAKTALHKPLRGYSLSNSVKSDDRHANIQLTFQHASDGSLAADVDIDEKSGFAHWGEVLRNFFTKGRTNPYVTHELLLATDLTGRTLDPGYDLVLKA